MFDEEKKETLRARVIKMLAGQVGLQGDLNEVLDILLQTDWKQSFNAFLELREPYRRECFVCGRSYYTSDVTDRQHTCIHCRDHWNIAHTVYMQCDRADNLGLPATLTPGQWLQTLEHFNWKCAYCQKEKYQHLEHFIPIKVYGGGTTQSNCVPSCKSCNHKKGSRLPREVVHKFPNGAIEHIQSYLNQFS